MHLLVDESLLLVMEQDVIRHYRQLGRPLQPSRNVSEPLVR